MEWKSMNQASLILGLIGILFGMTASISKGELVVIQIEGEITNSSPQVDEWLNTSFEVGDLITGEYIYNSSTVDSDLYPDDGTYIHSTPPYGIFLNINGFLFQSDLDNLDFTISIQNRGPGDRNFTDTFVLNSRYNSPVQYALGERPLGEIAWRLDDFSGTAIDSPELLPFPPVLEDWESIYGLSIQIGERGSNEISGRITSAQIIPEPATLLIMGLGGLALIRKSYSINSGCARDESIRFDMG